MIGKVAAFVVVIGLSWPASTYAASERSGVYQTGNELYENCSSKQGEPTYWQKSAACSAYVMGVVDGIGASEVLEKSLPVMCIPLEVTVGQMVDIVTKSLRENPASRHLGASGRVMLALAAAFPCRN